MQQHHCNMYMHMTQKPRNIELTSFNININNLKLHVIILFLVINISKYVQILKQLHLELLCARNTRGSLIVVKTDIIVVVILHYKIGRCTSVHLKAIPRIE